MGPEAREILFIDNNGTVIHRRPLDSYAAGDIQETKELLAKEMEERHSGISFSATPRSLY
jgi:hypothetical protein